METICKLETVNDYNALVGVETKHPLVSVIDFSEIVVAAAQRPYTHLHFGLYAVYLKELECGAMIYGRNTYDYQNGTLVFIAPGQVAKIMVGEQYQAPSGKVLLFHPDLLHGTALAKQMVEYKFFSYDTNEALHISENERKIVTDCLSAITAEMEQRMDKYSKRFIVNNIQMLLDYCIRFYDRQFITRDNINKGVVAKFATLLNDYYRSDLSGQDGVPTVAFFAEKLNLSANYFGELIKRETGKTALDYIHLKIIDEAKNRILSDERSISEISYRLGFKYPQHFIRLFKNQTGLTPNAYRGKG